MSFEVGKLYTFKENEFEKSRESGKLVFKIRDPASATPYIIKPFEYQIQDIPDRIVCEYKGNDTFEQDVKTVVPELYEVGAEYKFRVMRQDNNIGAKVSIRDDARGLTFYPIDLGRQRFERFQRITCKVLSTAGGELRLECVKEAEVPRPSFQLADLRRLKGGRLLVREEILARLLENPIFDEVRSRMGESSPYWVLSLLESVTHNLAMWFPSGGRFRMNILRQVCDLALSLIERSGYLSLFPQDDRRPVQHRLSEVVIECEDYLKAASLIKNGYDVEFITDTLDSLISSGWLYKPAKKMRLMMAIFTLKNSYAHDYTKQIFKIIRDHHADVRFIEEFGEGFVLMLQIYIDNESKFIDPSNLESLRDLIEAIAIQLLLTQNREFARWSYLRGRLYTLAMLLIGRKVPALVDKGVAALTDSLDMPLEYSWKDLDDINRLCYANLSGVIAAGRLGDHKGVSSYEGQTVSLTVDKGEMRLSPVVTGSNTRQAVEISAGGSTRLSVMLNDRLEDRNAIEGRDLSKHHVMWRELENSLFDPSQKVHSAGLSKPQEFKKVAPVVGDELTFRVVGRDDADMYTFKVVITDPVYQGKGTINSRDIVAYPVSPTPESFCLEGRELLLRGRVIAVGNDGRVKMSVEKEIDDEIVQMAEDDRNEETEILAVVTRDLGESCLGVTDGGYAVLIHKRGQKLSQGDQAAVRVTEVGWNKKSNKPYIGAEIVEVVEDVDMAENYDLVKKWFNFLLARLANDAVYVPAADEVKPESEEVEVMEVIPDSYISADAVGGLSRLFDALASVSRDDIAEVYTDLAVARLLAMLTGDTYRARFMALKQALVEGLSRFAIDGRIDGTVVNELERRVNEFPGNDRDLLRRVEVLKALASLDQPLMGDTVALPDERDSSLTGSLRRMVVSYNMLRGLRLNHLRQEIMKAIYALLNISMPDLDVSRVNASEGQMTEFKESLVYPAGNNMLADEKKQGLEIAQVIDGMLNSLGGTLYIGVANTGVPHGLVSDFIYLNNGFEKYDLEDVKDKFSLKFCKVLRDHIGLTVDGQPLYPNLVSIEFDDIDNKCFAVVTVKPFAGVVRMADGSVFIRQDSSTVPLKKKADQTALDKNRRK